MCRKKCGAKTRICRCGHHRREHEQRIGSCSGCDCATFKARRCRNTVVTVTNGRCRRHGGRSLAGPESGTWKHGRRSRHRPVPLNVAYEQALNDPELFSFKRDTALLEAMLQQLTDQLNPGQPAPAAMQARILSLTDGIRKLKAAEHKRRRDLQLMVSIERHVAALKLVGEMTYTVVTAFGERWRDALVRAGLPADLVARLIDSSHLLLELRRQVAQAALRQPALSIDLDAADEDGDDEDNETEGKKNDRVN